MKYIHIIQGEDSELAYTPHPHSPHCCLYSALNLIVAPRNHGGMNRENGTKSK